VLHLIVHSAHCASIPFEPTAKSDYGIVYVVTNTQINARQSSPHSHSSEFISQVTSRVHHRPVITIPSLYSSPCSSVATLCQPGTPSHWTLQASTSTHGLCVCSDNMFISCNMSLCKSCRNGMLLDKKNTIMYTVGYRVYAVYTNSQCDMP
jgi:hypothetical protein